MGKMAVGMEREEAFGVLGESSSNAGQPFDRVESGLALQILNLDEIAAAYGQGAARAAANHVECFLNFELRDQDVLDSAEYVLRQLSEIPVAYDGQRFHLFVSLAPTGGTENCAQKVTPTVHGNPAFPDDAWCRRYRADMALAVNLFEAMTEGRLVLAWQPVCASRDPSSVLYHECLVRAEPSGSGDPCALAESAAASVEALERLGLIRALDRYVMAKAIEELRSEPLISLGVNVSASSLVDDFWWAEILATLEQSPRIARRLVIEMTETAELAKVNEAINLLRRFRMFGCEIALDDFGVGHAAIRSILTLSPNVVKIDKYFVHNARTTRLGARALGHMIGLATSFGATVIVEGIESAGDAALAAEAGAKWMQGYHLGRPTLSRPWRLRGNVPSEAAGRRMITGTGGQDASKTGRLPFAAPVLHDALVRVQ